MGLGLKDQQILSLAKPASSHAPGFEVCLTQVSTSPWLMFRLRKKEGS